MEKLRLLWNLSGFRRQKQEVGMEVTVGRVKESTAVWR